MRFITPHLHPLPLRRGEASRSHILIGYGVTGFPPLLWRRGEGRVRSRRSNCPEDNQMLQRGDLRRCFICHPFHRAKFSAPITSIGGEKRFCLGVVEPRNDRRCSETGEERKKNSADLNDRE